MVAALTLHVPLKWIDNLLSRHRIPGVDQSTQGTTRRLSPGAVIRIEVIRILNYELGIPVRRSVQLAEELALAEKGCVSLGGGAGQLLIDPSSLERRIASRLADAVESAPRRTRGRPRGTRGLGRAAD